MAYTNIVKTAPLSRRSWLIERRPNGDGTYSQIEHILFHMKSGSVIDVQPVEGVIRNVFDHGGSNAYPPHAYAWGNNKIWISPGNDTGEIFEYDPVTGVTEAYNISSHLSWYNSNYRSVDNDRQNLIYNSRTSTDGHVYFPQYRHLGMPQFCRYNVITKTFDIGVPSTGTVYPPYDAAQARIELHGYKINTPASPLNGIYAYYWLDNAWKDNDLQDLIITEAGALGSPITFAPVNWLFALHVDDREVVSATRRIYGPINIDGTDAPGDYLWRIIDIKSPATWYTSNRDPVVDGPGVGWTVGMAPSDA
jgi:hypothetical protein